MRFVNISLFVALLCHATLLRTAAQEIVSGQRVIAERVQITFVSRAPLDTISATHSGAHCEFDATTGKLRFVVPVADFQFRNSLIQQHFSRYFLETDKFPNAIFEGGILEFSRPNFESEKVVPVHVRGIMTLHGVQKELNANGHLKWENKTLAATSTFVLKISDFGIQIPSLLRDNIAENVEINLNAFWTNPKG